ncbi:MAG TPA: fibronectin type III domain-containing protein, partial [Thermoanaerobaculia bacterium]|nr:fibronectin type III domain-containing protein [Thermoanaerobaculia bacterium]
GTSTINVTWTGSTGAHHYELERKSNNSVVTLTANGTSFADAGLSAGTTYVYRVRAVDAQGGSQSSYSNWDLATMMTFTSVQNGTRIAANAFDELFNALNAVRRANGSSNLTWANILGAGVPAPGSNTLSMASHITALRTRFNDALAALAVSSASYQDPSLGNGSRIKAVHVQQLQERAQ